MSQHTPAPVLINRVRHRRSELAQHGDTRDRAALLRTAISDVFALAGEQLTDDVVFRVCCEVTCRDAADIIRELGWCQFLAEYDGTVCASHALVIAARGNRTNPEYVALHLGFDDEFPLRALRRWNDALNRTEADVLARLDGGAA